MSRPRPRARARGAALRIVALNKPLDMLSQFNDDPHWPGLARLVSLPGLYPAGRLDRDSEGLLILTNDGALQSRLTAPDRHIPKSYFARIGGPIDPEALRQLREGVTLADGPTRPARVEPVARPHWLWPSEEVGEHWLRLALTEGRNRQVRRMCAQVGWPVLRLVRWRVGSVTLDGLAPGEWREVAVQELVGEGGDDREL